MKVAYIRTVATCRSCGEFKVVRFSLKVLELSPLYFCIKCWVTFSFTASEMAAKVKGLAE